MFGISGYIAVAAGVIVALSVGATVVQTKRLESAKQDIALADTAKLAWKEAADAKDAEMADQRAQHQRALSALATKAKADASRRADFAKIEKEVANAPNAECAVGPGIRAAIDGLRQRQGVVAGQDGSPVDRPAGSPAIVPTGPEGAGSGR